MNRMPADQNGQPRRSFILSAIVGVGVATVGRAKQAVAWPSISRAEPSVLPSEWAGYPVVTALPRGYKLFVETGGRPDGFRTKDELAMLFRGDEQLAGGVRYPLWVFATKDATAELQGTDERYGKNVLLTADARAMYYDGSWEVCMDFAGERIPQGDGYRKWATRNLHSMVRTCGEFKIGIRASRRMGIGLAQLRPSPSPWWCRISGLGKPMSMQACTELAQWGRRPDECWSLRCCA